MGYGLLNLLSLSSTVLTFTLHVRTEPARLNVARGRLPSARPPPLKIASPPELYPSGEGGRASIQLWRAAIDLVVSLARTAEYQNKGARRAVAAPARRPAGVAGCAAPHALMPVRFRTALIEVVRCELDCELSTAKGFSFVPILEDPVIVLCFRARAAISPALLRSRITRSVLNRDEVLSVFRNSVTVIPRNAYAERFEIFK
ncbi:unnamed protein product [Arctia plantaginis]|uniref:Uncharacterized protein n=1 Tax=Arctia plantaginis TaxID=874455 RepID=A0A8S0ZXZ4_ARCPL|nr:unnamed protein product [Arctia plantaginis]